MSRPTSSRPTSSRPTSSRPTSSRPTSSRPVTLTTTTLENVLTFLAPLFLIGDEGDPAGMVPAKQAAGQLLTSYGARTNHEACVAARTIAFSFGALDALSRSAAADLSVNQVLRLRGNACALHRSAHKNEASLTQLHKAGL